MKTYKQYFKNEIQDTIKGIIEYYELPEDTKVYYNIKDKKVLKKYTYYKLRFYVKNNIGDLIMDYLGVVLFNDRNEFINKTRGFNLGRSANNGICFYSDVQYMKMRG